MNETTQGTDSLTAIQVVQKEIADLNAKIINDALKRKASAEMSTIDKRILKQKEQQLKFLNALSGE